MKLNQVLLLLKKYQVSVFEDLTDAEGYRRIIFGCALPNMPYGGRTVYSTLIMSPGQDEVSLEEREAVKRRLCHLMTDIFGDDPELALLEEEDEDSKSHLHHLVPKK